MKKYILGVFVFLLLSTSVFAQSNNWADYGISEEDAKYLSESEKQEILSSLTPQQTLQKIEEDIKKNGTSDIGNLLLSPRQPSFGVDPSKQDTSHITSCFDLYSFGSIEADMTSQTSNTIAGTKMSFSGDIKNNNDYPIVQGTLYVKIFKTAGAEKDSNGPDVADQFMAVENISIPARSSIPASFVWNVPANAQTGEYQLVTYFTSDKKFNLLGLSFTDDIVGNSSDFSIEGENTAITFDKSSVVINDNQYYFAAYPPRIPKDEPANISLSIENTTNETQDTQIVWKLYKWDAMNPSNLIRTFTEDIQVQQGTQTVTVSIPENTDPVYYLVGELMYKDTKSIVNIRYVKDGVDKVRLNFPSITSYPLESGKQTTVFTCLHNSGTSSQVPNNKVVLEVLDKNGRSINSYTYEGIITGEMMAIKNDFTPKNNMDVFSVHASIYTDGVLVDESMMQYDCKVLDPSKCTSGAYKIMSILIGLLVLLGIIFYSKKTQNVEKFITPLAILFIVASVLIPHVSEAKSQTWNTTVNKNFAYMANRFGYSVWAPALSIPNITIKYNVQVINKDTGTVLGSNAKVPVGTNLTFKFLTHKSTDVYWFGTGYSADSPYGEWGKDATPPPIACNEKDFLENFARTSPINTSQDYNQDVYIPLVVDFPLKTITGIDNLTCSALEGDETKGYVMECKVTAPGTITSQFNFTATQGKFYYRYKQGVCYGNIIPLKVTDDIRDWKTLNFQSVYSDIYFGAIKISDYSLDVPQQTISYNLTAFDPPPANLPPARPSITGAKNGFPATEYTFDFKATDPDNDQIRYAIDWNDDGKIDQWLPAVGNVNSGTIQKGSKTWSSIGLKTIKAQTFDEQGNSSDWTTHTINLTPILHAPVASLTSVSNITEKSAIINWKYSDKDGDDQINYEIQIAKTRADLLTERNLVKNPFGGSRPDIISARTHPISGLSPDTTYYVRIRVKADAAPAWSLWTDGNYTFRTLKQSCDNSHTEGEIACIANEEVKYTCVDGTWETTKTGKMCGGTAPTATLKPTTAITPKTATINWTYSDKEGDNQDSYRIQIAVKKSDFAAGTSLKDLTGGSRADIITARTHPVSGLSPDTTYFVRIQVKSENAPNWSNWTDGSYSFKTLKQSCDNSHTEGEIACIANEEVKYTCVDGTWETTKTGKMCGGNAPTAVLLDASPITHNTATIKWKYSDKDGDDQINYEIQIAKTRADLLTERNLVKNPFGGSRPDIISARTHPISGLSPDTTYYVRIRVKADAAPAWSLWTDGFYKFTTKEIDDATTFACDDPQTVLPEQSATFSVSPRGADSYKWYRTTTSLDQIGDSYKYTEKFDSEGSYSRTVRVVDQAVTKILTCNVNVGCGEEPSNCKDGKIQINSCTPTGWKTTATDKNCNGTNPQTPLVTAFEFDPNIVEEGGSCPLILKATDVTSCTLKKGTTEFPYDAINNKISIFKTEVLPVGTYDLSCIGADDGPMKQFGSKSCYSNPIIKED